LQEANSSSDGLRKRGQLREMWQNWIIGFLGIWMIIASFTINGNPVNELIVGIAVAILGFWTAVQR
jgi:hypothetical protein